jgi:membrane dipeptidase
MLRYLGFILPVFFFLTSCQSYKKIHNRAILVDTHNDVLSSVTMKGMSIEQDLTGKAQSDISRFKKGGVDIQVFSIFCDEQFGKDTAFKFANIEIDSLYAIVSRNPAKMMLVTDPQQLQEAIKKKKLGCMIGVEGGHMIEDNIANLDSLYKRGTRYMTLTWNNSTSWATSAADESKMAPGTQRGLTPFGRQVVRRMNELGMMVDLSHVGVQTFWDAINTSTQPVIASHSSVYALCPVPRNLNDEQIIAIGKKGGVIDLNFYSGFLDSNYTARQKQFNAGHQHEIDSLKNLKWASYSIEEWLAKEYPAEANELRPPLSVLLDHLDYIVKLAGVDHVGIGSDFDGISSSPQQLDDVTSFPLITKELLKRGYNKKDIEKILGGNFIRVFRACQQGRSTALTSIQ